MNGFSKRVLGAAVALAGVAFIGAVPAAAYKEAPKKDFKLSKEERAAIIPLQTAVQAKDAAAATAALPAARAAAASPDAKLAVGSLGLQLGQLTKDRKQQLEGVDLMIDSGAAPAESLPQLLQVQANFAIEDNNYPKAEAALAKLTQIAPNDANTLITLAQLQMRQKKSAQSVATLQRAIAMQKAAGQAVPETWYATAVKGAYDAKLVPQTFVLSREWLAAYPSATNWRDALTIYRQLASPDKSTETDTFRLMRALHVLKGEADFFDYADAVDQSGYPGEVKAVLDEATASGVDVGRASFSKMRTSVPARIQADKASLPASEKSALAAASGRPALRMGDAFYGYGDYAKAATLYRAALQKGQVDANLVNTRLGLALAQSGQKAEAEAAFKAITGPRSELAAFMLVWLSQRS
ncbi:MAG TPA: hypothetical protein VJR87_10920 [Allosphingosinicella sp.]|nr:hypothetical protein [Allosphingosinicella sp.]